MYLWIVDIENFLEFNNGMQNKMVFMFVINEFILVDFYELVGSDENQWDCD